MRIALATRRHVADAGGAAAAGAVDERDRHRHQFLVHHDLVNHARHQIGTAAYGERDHELHILGGFPALGQSGERERRREP